MIPEFKRVVGYVPVSGRELDRLGKADRNMEIPWEFHADSAFHLVAILVAEHARLTGATVDGIKEAVETWFANPEVLPSPFQEEDMPILDDVEVDVELQTIRLSFAVNVLTDDEILESFSVPDPE